MHKKKRTDARETLKGKNFTIWDPLPSNLPSRRVVLSSASSTFLSFFPPPLYSLGYVCSVQGAPEHHSFHLATSWLTHIEVNSRRWISKLRKFRQSGDLPDAFVLSLKKLKNKEINKKSRSNKQVGKIFWRSTGLEKGICIIFLKQVISPFVPVALVSTFMTS